MSAFDRHDGDRDAEGAEVFGVVGNIHDLHKLPLEGDLDALVQEELSKRIAALIERYHIDPGLPAEQVYLTLACRLAFDHVPAFRISRKRRAKPKWTLDKYRALVDAVDANRTGIGLKAAINRAMEQPGWRWGRDIRSIEARYHEAVRIIQRSEYLCGHSPEQTFEALVSWYGLAGQAPTK